MKYFFYFQRLYFTPRVSIDPVLNFFTERYGAAYANEVNSFIAGIAKGVSAKPDGYDGLQAQKLADAATESWKTGKPVKVS